MRRLAVAACVLLLMTLVLPSQATALTVTRTWGVGVEPFGVTIDPRDGRIYVAISDHYNYSGSPENMWIVDPAVPYGSTISLPAPQVMSVLDTALDRLFVTAGALTVVDTNTHAILASIPNVGVLGVALDPATHHVFSSSLHGLALVDGTTATVLATRAAPSGDAWWAVADDPVRHRVYVTDLSASSVVVLDDVTLAVVGTVALPAVPRLALSVDVERGLVYVGGFTSGTDQFGRLYAIDEGSLQIVKTLDVGGGVASPFSLTLDPNTNSLYASMVTTPGYPGNALVTVDLASFSVRQRVPLDFEPGQSALGPDGHLYVSEFDKSALAQLSFDSPPSVSVALSSTSPRTNDVLTATATGTDPDGDALTYTYTWTVNGVVRRTATTAANTDSLDLSVSGSGDKGDVVAVSVVASDGTLTSAPASASATVANSAPTVSVSLSTTTPTKKTVVTATAAASDPDGDALTFTYTWTLGTQTVRTATTASTSDAFDLGTVEVENGTVLAVSVVASDGTASASASASATVTRGR